jgi:hypothetical protein
LRVKIYIIIFPHRLLPEACCHYQVATGCGRLVQVFNIIGFTLTAKRVELISRIRHRADIRYQEVQHPLSVLK